MREGPTVTILGPRSGPGTAPSTRLGAFADHLAMLGWTVRRPVGGSGPSRARSIPIARWAAGALRLEGDVQPSLAWRAYRQATFTRSDVTLVSVPPFSGLAGTLAPVGRLTVVDFRDVWLHNADVPGLRAITQSLERVFVRRVAAITHAGTDEFGALLGRASGLPPDRVVAVPNGVLPEELPNPRDRERQPGPLRMIFAGSVYGRHQLRRVAAAVDRAGPTHVQLEIVGPTAPDDVARCLGTASAGIVCSPALPRPALYRRITDADVGVIALPDSFPHDLSVPVKAYEYFALGVPVLAIAPSTSALLALAGPTSVVRVDPGDDRGIDAAVADLTMSALCVTDRLRPPPGDYDRRIGLGRLSALLAEMRAAR